MECWWVQRSSHDGSVHAHSCARSFRGTQLMAAGWDFVETKALLGIRGMLTFTQQDSKEQSHLPEGSYCHG